MESDSEFYRRRRMDDERSRANTAWEIQRTRMATTPEGFAAAAGLSEPDLATEHQRLPSLRFYDAGPTGRFCPVEGQTVFANMFVHAMTTRIGYWIDFANPLFRRQDGNVPVGVVIRAANGHPLDQRQYPIAAYAARPRVSIYNEMGYPQPGLWVRGQYLLDVYAGPQPVVRNTFAVM